MLHAGAYYIHLMKKISGIDFENLERKDMRSGAYSNLVPVVRSQLQLAAGPSCWREWRRAADLAGPRAVVKFTLPGPMTMADGMVNLHYEDEAALATDLISCIKAELAGLVEAGCRHVQIDEPVMMRWGCQEEEDGDNYDDARYPERALATGLDNLARCLEGLPDTVTKVGAAVLQGGCDCSTAGGAPLLRLPGQARHGRVPQGAQDQLQPAGAQAGQPRLRRGLHRGRGGHE